jgi:hypothetical protein
MKAIPVVVGLTAIVGLVDAAGAQGVARKQLFVEGDLVRGAQQGAPGPFCVLNSSGWRRWSGVSACSTRPGNRSTTMALRA